MINQEEYEILKGLDDKRKWISRDKNKEIWIYTKKPYKGTASWGPGEICEPLPRRREDLFQFIQWEDEEPYRISDLIKEYEDRGDIGYTSKEYAEHLSKFNEKLLTESEEEMKKDKEWLKDEVARIYDTRDYWSVDDLRDEILDSINELDEPKKVVVPEDVYEHIKMNKVGGVPLDIALDGAIGKLEILGRDGIQFHEFRNNQDSYARAWLAYPDIEVEKEPLYYVVKDGVVILSKRYRDYDSHKSHWIGTVTNKEYIKENLDKVRFTEQEIKDYDKRFWAFAVPVEELENER